MLTMPFKKNDVKTQEWGRMGARKPYTLEQAQLEKMRKILNKDLTIAEKFQESKELNPVEEKKLQILQARILKYADKLHASKTDVTSDGKQIVINLAPEIAKQNEID